MTYLDRLTSPQLDACSRSIPLLLPTGATEQHGPHLPLATDRMIAEHFSAAAERILGEGVIVLPTVGVGCSDHHMEFVGTLTLRHETFLAQVVEYAESGFAHGFETLVILNAHGGNQGIGRVAMEQLGSRHPQKLVIFASWWQLATEELLGISQTGPGGVGHAGELETSLMLAIAPELVEFDQAPERQNEPAYPWDTADLLRGSRASLYRRMIDVAASGVFGEPRAASAEIGRAVHEAVVEQLVALLRSVGP
jgi:creatinine amidohydrolase